MHNVFWHYKPTHEKTPCDIVYRGALLWNSLPANVRNLDFKEFKNLQKKRLLSD